MFSYGDNIKFCAVEDKGEIRFTIEGFPEGIEVKAIDFGKQLEKRKCEGVDIDPNEEIEFVSGVEGEKTTGQKIEFTYKNGDIYSAFVVAGTLCKKLVKSGISVHTWEVGGINTNEKNKEYIETAIQKMVLEKSSLGGVVECQVQGIDVDSLKRGFTSLVFEVPETEAVQFSRGVMASKLTAENYEKEGRILVTLRPDLERKSPCPAVSRAVVVESLLAMAAADMGM